MRFHQVTNCAIPSMASLMTCPTPVHSTITSGSKPTLGTRANMIRRSKGTNQLGLRPRFERGRAHGPRGHAAADQRSQQTNRPGARDQDDARLPKGPLSDRRDLLPGLGDDRRRLQQHSKKAERVVDPHRILGLDAPALRHEAVDLLDAAFSVLAVAAHVPLANRAVRARHGVGTPDDADDEIALLKARLGPGSRRGRAIRARAPGGFARRRPAVFALDDLDVGAAHADRDGFDEH